MSTIVLDLDSTIVCSNPINNNYYVILDKYHNLHHRIGLLKFNDSEGESALWTVLRPYAKEFIEFIIKYFDKIIIWSAGQPDYVHKIVELLFRDYDRKPDIVYTSEQTIITQNSIIYKPLKFLLEDPKINGIDENNTIVIDDRLDTFSLNPRNGILIPEYIPKYLDDILYDNDNALLKVIAWLAIVRLRNTNDLISCDKSNIFEYDIEDYMSMF